MSTFDHTLPDVEVNVPAPADFSTALAEGFARRMSALAQRGGASADGVRWAARAAFAVSRATSEGHVCVPLEELAQRYEAGVEHVRDALLASHVASDGAQPAHALRPLVVDREGRLYLARYYDYERRLAQSLVAHAQAMRGDQVSDGGSPHGMSERLLRYFGPPQDDQIDWQRVAAVMALSGRLTIVSGGPGTGKTTTVVGVLACLLDARADLRIALAAPTGKAAQRMQEALLARAGSLPPELAARLPQTSFTLHRLLGTGPDGRFRHHRDNPLPYDVIVIDEASMIDVAMAAHLFDALARDTHLVMLGDKDQLAAVEAGAVFAELSAQPAFTGERVGVIAAALKLDEHRLRAALPTAAAASTADQERAPFSGDLFSMPPDETPQAQSQPAPLADCVVWLERNYRFGLDSAIGRLSLAIRRGAAQQALEVLVIDPCAPCAAAFHEDSEAVPSERTIQRLAAGFAPYAQALSKALADAPAEAAPGAAAHALGLFDALNRFRILCATRLGPRGVDQMNSAMAAHVRRAARVPLAMGAQWFAGRPVMVTRNDYALGLFNGDIGIALPGADGALRVYFRSADGGLRAVSPAALPPHDTAFALTVHKSQGSEFEHAVLMLPSTFSRVLSRELVYTAITRARERVEVVGARAVLLRAIATPTQRDSGLAARIAEAMRGGRMV
ncbi:exodeoxyribonuclease V subunit alpha [Paraburkholderia sp. LEh10]|uniref:exodeoxyribonuclease V subunit alpha n=1 Tax=Paraburkholderia sp. LEh10 TaxID=2821353 RepID=UPI001AE34E14|nr:exodeoxyribonuclease V subunit alpha [Paraburkholderia sp. LEh10]MBP0589945.1 exodeoxyribonuclease V subunit alpha [Paraburkholderia sp. LEh10]